MPRVQRVCAGTGIVLAATAGALVATSDHLVDPVAYGTQIAVMLASTVGVALYWAVKRPAGTLALWLLAYAGAVAGIALQGASNPLLHSIGVLFDPVMFFLGYFLVFAFPLGRVVTGFIEKALLAGIGWAIVASFMPFFLFSPVVSGGAPLAGCNAKCPTNPLMLADRPGLASGFGTTEQYLEAVLAAAIVAGLCYRLARASAPRRRASLPVYVPALLLTIPFGLLHAAHAGIVHIGAESADTIGWFVTAGRTFLSIGFLFSIMQAMVFAGAALTTILGRLGESESPSYLRRLVAEVVDDPPLELAFEVDRAGGFVDTRGGQVDAASIDPSRSVTELERRGETVALIVHDPALESDPELIRAAGRAVLLALESGRLEAELEAKVDELRDSRSRIVAAGEAERRKIERDLHDGAQQRLMAIQIKLALLRDGVDDPELAAELDEIGDDASAAVADLRGLAHGIYPTVLRERGLGAGLRALAETAPIRVDVFEAGIGRCTPAVEAAVYFCAAEAIQNATKYAGADARVAVTLDRRGRGLDFSVADDGVGFDPGERATGTGLAGMQDRIGPLGGTLEVTSVQRRGTTVRGRVPDAGWAG